MGVVKLQIIKMENTTLKIPDPIERCNAAKLRSKEIHLLKASQKMLQM
jgi:hypothetical protein